MPHNIFTQYAGPGKTPLPELCGRLLLEQRKSWPGLEAAYQALSQIRQRSVDCGRYKVTLQYNPGRAISSGAAVDAESIRQRPCFLCIDHLPQEQQGILYRQDCLILCNPAPIFDRHFTVATIRHQPQEVATALPWILQMAIDAAPDYCVFYNGPASGASAPDHLHLQMIPADALPLINDLKVLASGQEISSVKWRQAEGFDRSIILLESKDAGTMETQFQHLLKVAQKSGLTLDEPLVNVLCTYEKDTWRLMIFFRQKHRPHAYFATGENRIFVSPGTIDMAGVVITPLLKDYERLDGTILRPIYREVSLNEEAFQKIIDHLDGFPAKRTKKMNDPESPIIDSALKFFGGH